MKPRVVVGVIVGIVVAGAAWAVFRPELLVLDKRAADPFPGQSPAATASAPESARALVSGTFRGLAHETRGTATIHELAGGKRILRLSGFETSNGPDVRVLLVAAGDVPDNDTVRSAGSVELGSLKGNIGDQNYDVPAGLDLGRYRSVVIWCNRFGVNFGTASLMDASAAAIRSGQFHKGAHETRGTATIYRLADGSRVLRLTGFETSNGPDVRVLLIAAGDASDNETVKASSPVELGSLKGNIGDQNYDVPAGLDLETYRSVVIWCNRFGVNFGAAPLS